YSPGRPSSYNLDNLPRHTEKEYWETINKLLKAVSKAASTTITKATGISCMPLAAASPAFVHPSFFPLDPFHLFYKDIIAFLWDLWTIFSSKSERIHLSADKARKLGEFLVKAMETLSPCFCGPVHDPFSKRQSQYKIYEWMALAHWYLIPLGIELQLEPTVLANLAEVVEIIEFAMTI
ncbi:hypothetical protein JAAARDRAFT_112501, partial [Jaapia argillacea MUCL 33604]